MSNFLRGLSLGSALCGLVALACSTNSSGLGEIDGGTGGKATGGATAAGGRTGTGGADSTGGATNSGGATATGGATNTGGADSTGGKSGTGGATATGGKSGTGGAAATGGKSGTGGATATGGATGTGGNNTGGRMGTGGTGGVGPECTKASDCHLVTDCCSCMAVPVGGPTPPACTLTCVQSRCAAQQLPNDAVACLAGRCVAGFNCDASKVQCKIAIPACAAGQVPSVNPEGTCYSGGCVAADQCKSVTNCAACTGPDLACVSYDTGRAGNDFHCVTIPAACQGKASCSCMGPSTCVPPAGLCNESSGGKEIQCSCPTC